MGEGILRAALLLRMPTARPMGAFVESPSSLCLPKVLPVALALMVLPVSRAQSVTGCSRSTTIIDMSAACAAGTGPQTNNLAGVGPNTGDPEEIRYPGVASFQGTLLDLVLTTPTLLTTDTTSANYMSSNPAKNGCSSDGNFGRCVPPLVCQPYQ